MGGNGFSALQCLCTQMDSKAEDPGLRSSSSESAEPPLEGIQNLRFVFLLRLPAETLKYPVMC